MKPNSTAMRIARKAAIKILDSNPNCTDEHFKDIRHLLDDDTVPLRSFNPEPCCEVNWSSYTNLYQIKNIYTHEITRGSLQEIAKKLGVSYTVAYHAVKGLQSSIRATAVCIDVIPTEFATHHVECYANETLLDTMTYVEACEKFNIHTSTLWCLIGTDQDVDGVTFKKGGRI